jgi:hypothetical protein
VVHPALHAVFKEPDILRVGLRVRAPARQRHPQILGKRLDIEMTNRYSMRNVGACPEAPARECPGSGGWATGPSSLTIDAEPEGRWRGRLSGLLLHAGPCGERCRPRCRAVARARGAFRKGRRAMLLA